MNTSRPDLLQVMQYCVTHFQVQRILLGAALFWPRYMQDLADPVHIFQAKLRYLTAAQSIDSQQQNDGAITDICCAITRETGNELLYLLPSWSEGNGVRFSFQPKQAGVP